MEAHGNCGRGGREYGDSLHPSVLNGVRSGDEAKVYPDDYCTECMKLGVTDNELCFHQHWNNLTKEAK